MTGSRPAQDSARRRATGTFAGVAVALLLAGCSWFGDADAPAPSAAAAPPPSDPASLAALDTTAGEETAVPADAPALGDADTALVPDAPAAEAAAVATAPAEPAVVAGETGIVAVRYSGERAPDRVQLVTAQGAVLEPVAIDRTTRETADDGWWPNIAVGVTGGSSSNVQTGINIGFPVFGDPGGERPAQVRTEARFRVPDAADYRANWQRYRVVLLFAPGTAQEERLEMLPPHPDAMLP